MTDRVSASEEDPSVSMTRPPLLSRPSLKDLFYGVVGNGPNKRILSFGSISTISEDNYGRSWTCEACNYENADHSNEACSMCGTRDNLLHNSHTSKSLSNSHTSKSYPGIEVSDDEVDLIIPKPNRRSSSVLRRLSTQTSVRKMLSKRFDVNNDDEVTLESLTMDQSTAVTHALTTHDDLATSVAMLTIEDAGGWACPDCTFINIKEMHLSCGVCGRPKPPTNKNSSDILQHASLQEFLTKSMLSGVDTIGKDSPRRTSTPDSFMDPQLHELLKFEEMANEKEYVATVIEEQKKNLGNTTLRTGTDNSNELRSILEEGHETLKMLQQFYEDEMMEYHAMELHLAQRAEEIERTEGVSPGNLLSRSATIPGAQRISAQVLQWHGQQRMLEEWECQLKLRKQEIDQLSLQHEEALVRLLQ